MARSLLTEDHLCPSPASLAAQTADNWATSPLQCMVPGYGYTPLVVGGVSTAPTSYPITYDQKLSCGGIVLSTPLVDKVNPSYVYGQMYVWKVSYAPFLVARSCGVSLPPAPLYLLPRPLLDVLCLPLNPRRTIKTTCSPQCRSTPLATAPRPLHSRPLTPHMALWASSSSPPHPCSTLRCPLVKCPSGARTSLGRRPTTTPVTCSRRPSVSVCGLGLPSEPCNRFPYLASHACSPFPATGPA